MNAHCLDVFMAQYELKELQKSLELPPSTYFRRGDEYLAVPPLNKSYVHKVNNIKISSPVFGKPPEYDGDKAQLYILGLLKTKEVCMKESSTIVVDVGGLNGDFGLYAASLGCKVTIFEPQFFYAQHIAKSVKLNGLEEFVTVRAEAVSSYKKVVPMDLPIKGASISAFVGMFVI